MARLSALGPPGESPAPVGMEPWMERIQELISAFRESKTFVIHQHLGNNKAKKYIF